MQHQLLADLILIIHAIFIMFVIMGFVLVVLGNFIHWKWIRNIWFRVIHLGAIGVVVAESWIGVVCPLTEWENFLRTSSGGTGYSASFIQYWLQKIIFYDFSPWVFTVAYSTFGILVLITWILIPPNLIKR